MAKVGIIMGSKSDLPIMQEAIDILNEFGIENHAEIVSAHRTPEKMMEYGKNAHNKGFSVIIAGAGGAAHLAGVTASITTLKLESRIDFESIQDNSITFIECFKIEFWSGKIIPAFSASSIGESLSTKENNDSQSAG